MTLLDTTTDNASAGTAGGPAEATSSVPNRRPDDTSAEGATIEADDNTRAQVERLVRQLDDRQLLEGFDDRRFAGEAITLAVEAFAHYDPKSHKLSHVGADDRQPKEISYSSFFRLVAMSTFAKTRNVKLAGLVLDRLIERA